MGRIPMCKCGTIKLWYGGRGDSEMSQHLTDWYSYSHVLHGIIFYWLLSVVAKGRLSVAARLVIAMGIEAGWEIFENTPFIINRYRTQTISHDYFGDSIVNSVGDMLSMLVGFLLASRLPAWVTVVLLIATEVILLALHPRQPHAQRHHADPPGRVDQAVADGGLVGVRPSGSDFHHHQRIARVSDRRV